MVTRPSAALVLGATTACLVAGCSLLVGLGDARVLQEDAGTQGGAADGPANPADRVVPADVLVEESSTEGEAAADGAPDDRTDATPPADSSTDAGGDSSSDAPAAQPVVLASGQIGATAIAVDSTQVYWTNQALAGGAVMACPVDGDGGARQLSQADEPAGIAVQGSLLFWIGARGGFWQCTTDCSGNATTFVSADVPKGIAVDSAYVYWTDQQRGTVNRCPLGGCTTPFVVAQLVFVTPHAVAVRGSYVYWTDDSGVILSCPTDGCPTTGPTYIASQQASPVGIAVDPLATYVYWVNQGPASSAGTVMRCPLTAGLPNGLAEPVAQEQITPSALAVDGTGVYWTNAGDADGGGGVMMCPAGGTCVSTPPIHLADGQVSPQGIALDNASVYWTAQTQVLKLAK